MELWVIPFLIYSNFNCCNTPSSNQMAKASSWQPIMDKYKSNAWSITNEVATVVAGKFTYTKVKHNTKQKALFLFLVVNCNTYIPHDSQLWMGKYKAHSWICYKNREVYASVYKAKSE